MKYIPWLILSAALFLALAYLKLRYSPVIYQVSSKLLFKKESKAAGQDRLTDLFLSNESQNLNDEIQILKSSGIAKRIIKNLALQTTYVSEGNVKSYQLHPLESPLWLDIISLKDTNQYVSFKVNIIDQNKLSIGESKDPVFFGQSFETPQGKFRFIRRPVDYHQYESSLFNITYHPLQDLANGLAGSFNINTVNDYSNVLQI
ncbi:MAG: hypothetical protein ABI151_04320, partial [Chitinophagaceae bacterium]